MFVSSPISSKSLSFLFVPAPGLGDKMCLVFVLLAEWVDSAGDTRPVIPMADVRVRATDGRAGGRIDCLRASGGARGFAAIT